MMDEGKQETKIHKYIWFPKDKPKEKIKRAKSKTDL